MFLFLLHYSEEQEQAQGFEAEEGLMPAEEVVPAEQGVTEEVELVSEEAEAWEEVEAELDEATRMTMMASALEVSGLDPSHLDMMYVLQQLASWQDARGRQQLLQKGECSHRGLPLASQTSCRSSS